MPGNWQFYCCCMWEYLLEEATDHPGGAADLWYRELLAEFGSMDKFPHIGCGAQFVPWKRGPSMVCEIQLGTGGGEKWEAFLAEQTPQALDDQLKKLSYDALTATFHAMPAEDIMKMIPITMPMTNIATLNGKEMRGVAKYPLDEWISSGAPEFTNEAWCMICLLLAERGKGASQSGTVSSNDAEIFDKLFVVANKMKETKCYN